MDKKKIMIVDDEESILTLVKNILDTQDFDVITAKDGNECLNILKKEKPDLILIDIMMPEMNGIELAEKIKSSPDNKSIKIVFLTVVDSKEVKSNMIKKRLDKIDFDDYITKPFDNQDLVDRVKKIVG